MQTSFLPIICDRTKPPPETADAACIAIEDATAKRYLCKSGKFNALIPATEWICAALARSIKIPVADSVVVKIQDDDELMFGSIWEGGSQKDVLAALPKVSNKGIFSETLAFDLTVHNEDRHIHNYLYLDLAGDIVAKLIDASKAFIYHSIPIPPLPFDPQCPTIISKAHWTRHHSFQKQLAVSTARRVLSLPAEWMERVLDGMPPEWIHPVEITELDRWWRDDRAARIDQVIQEL